MESLYGQVEWEERLSAFDKRKDLKKILEKMDLPFAVYWFDNWLSSYDINVYIQPKGEEPFTATQGRKVRKVLNEILLPSNIKWQKDLCEEGVRWSKAIKDFWIEHPKVLLLHISFEPLPKTCHLVTKTKMEEVTT